MNINKEQFLALSLSMSVGLTAACKKKAPANSMDGVEQDQAVEPTDEGINPTEEGVYSEEFYRYGACEEFFVEGSWRRFSFDVFNECYIECGVGEQNKCYEIWDECTDWDNTNECINFELMTWEKEAPDGCTRFVPEDPTFECYEWK